MAIVLCEEDGWVIDTETGQYLTCKTANREEHALFFTLHASDGSGILGTEVQLDAVDETGKKGPATVVRYLLRKSWIPSGKPEKPVYFVGQNANIAKLRDFLEVWRHRGGVKQPDPRFEFIDAREVQGDPK
jgi:hypothetical protein